MLKAESFIFFYITNNIRHRSNIKRRLLLFSDFFRFRGGLGFAAQGLNTHDIVIGLSEYFKNNWLVEVFYVGMTELLELVEIFLFGAGAHIVEAAGLGPCFGRTEMPPSGNEGFDFIFAQLAVQPRIDAELNAKTVVDKKDANVIGNMAVAQHVHIVEESKVAYLAEEKLAAIGSSLTKQGGNRTINAKATNVAVHVDRIRELEEIDSTQGIEDGDVQPRTGRYLFDEL